MKNLTIIVLVATFLSPAVSAQEGDGGGPATPRAAEKKLDRVAGELKKQLEEAIAEHAALMDAIKNEQLPLAEEVSKREAELREVREKLKETTRVLNKRTVDLANVTGALKRQEADLKYLVGFFHSYVNEFEASLHIAEKKLLQEQLDSVKFAPDNENLSKQEVLEAQLDMLEQSMDRIEAAFGGRRFEGTAVSGDGLVREGTFVLIGPAAFFLAADGSAVGTAEERLNSNEPSTIEFADPELSRAAEGVVRSGGGFLPFDPTLGSAHKIAETEETVLEHLEKGGQVVVAILIMAALALLIAIYKSVSFLFVRKPSKARIGALLEAVGDGDRKGIEYAVSRLKGPVGSMLRAGVDHLGHPKDLIEEVMYEKVLTARLGLNRMLPFIAICAASAPLLGLLGTVTGIIDTFKAIEVFGSGDVKSLSGGISKALITTELGLIVAIPSLILHAFLSRKARALVGHMETSAVAFMNQVARCPASSAEDGADHAPDPDDVRARVNEILGEILGVRPPQKRTPTKAIPELHVREQEAS